LFVSSFTLSLVISLYFFFFFFFFMDPATTEIYTLSLHDALPIYHGQSWVIGDRAFHRNPVAVAELAGALCRGLRAGGMAAVGKQDRKSTRLNSSHLVISYAVFCLKKKKKKDKQTCELHE